MLWMIFVGSVVAAVAVVAYSYQVLLGSWGRGHKRVLYAPPPLPPPPPNVSAMLAAVSLPEAPVKVASEARTGDVRLPMGTAPQPTVGSLASAPLPERFFPPLSAAQQAAAPRPPRRQARGSMPPPLPPRASRERSVVVANEFEDETNVDLIAH